MFELFSWVHFLYLLIAIAIPVGLFFVLKKANSDKEQMIVERILLATAWLFVVLEYVGRIIYLEDFNIGDNLPFNAFQVFVYLGTYAHFSRKLGWIKFGYLIAMPVSIVSLIFIPNIYTSMASFSLSVVCFVLCNSIIILYSIMSMYYTRYDLEHKDVLNSMITFAIIVAIAHIVNVFLRFTAWGLQADYFGTMAENYNLYICYVSKLIPVPFVVILPLLAVMIGLCYLAKLPFDVLKSRKEKREQLDEIIALGNLKEQQRYREEERVSKKAKSQILVRSQEKAMPNTPKIERNINSKDGFVKANRDIMVDHSIIEENKEDKKN